MTFYLDSVLNVSFIRGHVGGGGGSDPPGGLIFRPYHVFSKNFQTFLKKFFIMKMKILTPSALISVIDPKTEQFTMPLYVFTPHF